MDAQIRGFRRSDEEKLVELSLRAWAPVFASMEHALGPELSIRLHPDWRSLQEKEVRETLADSGMSAWVAESEQGVLGFVAAKVVDPHRLIGEVCMLAVDPGSQRRGIGSALTEHATAWLRSSGMRVAMIGTGADPGHAPARRTYEKANYTLIPMARYFKAL
jgi:ribosomal protein S18 acetylase RimI-like enzyme